MDCKSFKLNLDGNNSSSQKQSSQSQDVGGTATSNKIIINLAKPPQTQTPSTLVAIQRRNNDLVDNLTIANTTITTTNTTPSTLISTFEPKEILENILTNIEKQQPTINLNCKIKNDLNYCKNDLSPTVIMTNELQNNDQEQIIKRSKIFNNNRRMNNRNSLLISSTSKKETTLISDNSNSNDVKSSIPQQISSSLPETSSQNERFQPIMMNNNHIQPILEVEIESSSSPPSTSSKLSSSIPSSLSSLDSQGKSLHQYSPSSRKSVLFNTVTIYHFNRSQGFSSIPQQGGSTLGMKRKHFLRRRLSVDMFEEVRRRSRREILLKIKFEKRRAAERLISKTYSNSPDITETSKDSYLNNNISNMISAENNIVNDNNNTSNINDNKEGLILNSTNHPTTSSAASSSSTNTTNSESDDDESFSDFSDISDRELERDSYVFLQPIGVKLRRSLLRASGVGKIDPTEKIECKIIRDSRERSGCRCVNQCIPGLCECTLLGINCQVDRISFPCGCVETGCRNPMGRVKFDVNRVKGHLHDTLYRIYG